MSKPTWGEIMGDATMCRLAKRINRRYLFMSEEDILFLFQVFHDANRITLAKNKEV